MFVAPQRSRFGCMTCKKRRVKCDETLPACRKCTDTGRKCDGPATSKLIFVKSSKPGRKVSQKSQTLHVSSPAAAIGGLQLDPTEGRVLDYFLHKVAPCLAAAQDGSFWTSLVPQVIQQDAAARSAVLAISHMFEHPPDTSMMATDTSRSTRAQSQAIKWHSRSIRGFHANLSKMHEKNHSEVALLSCVLLTTIEFQQNNVSNAFALLKSGYDMANNLASSAQSNVTSTIKGILVPILARQTVLMASFGQLPPKEWFERFQSIAPTSFESFSSLTDARAGLYTCLWRGMEFIHDVHVEYMSGKKVDLGEQSPLRLRQAKVMQGLSTWDRNFFVLVEQKRQNFSRQEELAMTTMIMYWNVSYIWAATCFDMTHMEQDLELKRFERIVDCSETLLGTDTEDASAGIPAPFSFEMGVIPPLFFVGMRCRHPLVRRRTIELLRRAPKQEALYAADMNARAIEKIIQLEETPDIATLIENGNWQGEWPSQDVRCQHVSIQYELKGGFKVTPSLVYVRGAEIGRPEGLQSAIRTEPLY